MWKLADFSNFVPHWLRVIPRPLNP
jgi:hypothetical protein